MENWVEIEAVNHVELTEFYQMLLEYKRSPISQYWAYVGSEDYKSTWAERFLESYDNKENESD